MTPDLDLARWLELCEAASKYANGTWQANDVPDAGWELRVPMARMNCAEFTTKPGLQPALQFHDNVRLDHEGKVRSRDLAGYAPWIQFEPAEHKELIAAVFKYIAASSPAAVKMLIERVRKAEGAAEIVEKIGRMPDVAAYAGVGDGGVVDAVTALVGRAACAEAERNGEREEKRLIALRCAGAEQRAEKAEAERDGWERQSNLDAEARNKAATERDAFKAEMAACRHDYSAEKIWRETAESQRDEARNLVAEMSDAYDVPDTGRGVCGEVHAAIARWAKEKP